MRTRHRLKQDISPQQPVTPNKICLGVKLALVSSLFIGAFDTANAFCGINALWPFLVRVFDLFEQKILDRCIFL